jgi:hypothetical protein
LALGYRVDQSFNLAIDFPEPRFEMRPFRIRFGSQALPLFEIGPHIFRNHAWMPHLCFQSGKAVPERRQRTTNPDRGLLAG